MNNKIRLIIGREYLTRVKKKSFIVMTILAPLLLLAVYSIPVIVAVVSAKKAEEKTATIGLINESGFFNDVFVNDNQYTFIPLIGNVDALKSILTEDSVDYLLYIPSTIETMPEKAIVYSKKKNNKVFENFVERKMKARLENVKMRASGIDPAVLASVKTKVYVDSFVISDDGKEERSNEAIAKGLGFFSGFLVYLFIFMFGGQVMKGVMEEKSSRIVEVIMSSVKPFQLMMGKIIGIGLVGLTQFLLWVVLTGVLIGATSSIVISANIKKITEKAIASNEQLNMQQTLSIGNITNFNADLEKQIQEEFSVSNKNTKALEAINEGLTMIKSINIPLIILAFLLYFILGYILYSSMFAAIGGAVDNETDSQQFILPITLPMIIPMMLISYILGEPNGTVSVWLSLIPFTSPLTMMFRLPIGVPIWQILTSLGLLLITILLIIWLAAKIYRTGILMYGKKITWKELWKWIRYD